MRNPKKGDRCEYAIFNSKLLKKERVCDVRHLQGTPPGLLMPVKQDRETALLFSKHAQEAMSWSGVPFSSKAVKRQKKGHTDAVQESLV